MATATTVAAAAAAAVALKTAAAAATTTTHPHLKHFLELLPVLHDDDLRPGVGRDVPDRLGRVRRVHAGGEPARQDGARLGDQPLLQKKIGKLLN